MVPPEELLRQHLAPALVDRGALSAEDAARLTAVGLDPIEVPAGGDVHVHLGHVEVVQQAPALPKPEPPRSAAGSPARADRVDHADYLARQQRRWS
jgi:cell division septation protein DedD